MLEEFLLWGAAIVALVVSVFSSLTEGALFFHSPSRLEEALKNAERRARLTPYLTHIDRYLFSARMLTLSADIVLVALSVSAVLSPGEASLGTGLLVLATATLMVLVIADIVPTALAQAHADNLLPRVLPPIAILDRLAWPGIYPLWKLRCWLLHRTGELHTRERLADDILSVTLEGERSGLLNQEDASMIESIIEFREVEVREVMTPRTDMICIDISTPVDDTVEVIVNKGHSRIPVFEEIRDRIIGIAYAKDILRRWQALRTNGARDDASGSGDASSDGIGAVKVLAEPTLRSLVRKPYFVPETKPIGDLLKEFRARKVHMAIVLDEYGGTAGLVTIEDILEEIVGEIEDEYDDAAVHPHLVRIDDATTDVEAKTHVAEVNKELHLDLPEDSEYETLGGFVMYALGKVPQTGEAFSRSGCRFTILAADERRVDRVRIERIPEPAVT